ncbi:MAG: hypothetical protein Sylvanvirus9_16 [Sylvanvirus sp.]|uniref:Uncharacterized protein n=1 Tax=Sylvanvirus sp. TaxID=2487774 RepID=A0A3G5AHZ5_9VIRU|nr:MAG: hypothetical protein Sylvanvirus9_16 [Sylvanvirus sp.]
MDFRKLTSSIKAIDSFLEPNILVSLDCDNQEAEQAIIEKCKVFGFSNEKNHAGHTREKELLFCGSIVKLLPCARAVIEELKALKLNDITQVILGFNNYEFDEDLSEAFYEDVGTILGS